MGCDIHVYIERQTNQGVWVSHDPWVRDKDHKEYYVPHDQQLFTERDYALFALLADVRNEPSGAYRIEPIDEPRSMPADACARVRQAGDGPDWHSHSYFTLAELLAVNWTATSCVAGHIQASSYYAWLQWGKSRGQDPADYERISLSEATETMTPSAFDAAIKSEAVRTGRVLTVREVQEILAQRYAHVYIEASWDQPHYRRMRSFVSEVLPKLCHIAHAKCQGDYARVRVVLWFDN